MSLTLKGGMVRRKAAICSFTLRTSAWRWVASGTSRAMARPCRVNHDGFATLDVREELGQMRFGIG